MGRWEPDARGRLLVAALELFADQGYEATTAAQIAEHAGLTRTTLFRHFPDKREILFQGQSAMVAVVAAGVESAPSDATAIELLHAGVRALCDAHVPEQQEIGRQIQRLIAVSAELEERSAFKRSVLTRALEAALLKRLGDQRLVSVLSDLGIRAYYDGFAAWTVLTPSDPLPDLVLQKLEELEGALRKALPVSPAPQGRPN